MPACIECQFGTITMHSNADKCSASQNVNGLHPYALRHDELLCGSLGAWFVEKAARSAIYKADPGAKV